MNIFSRDYALMHNGRVLAESHDRERLISLAIELADTDGILAFVVKSDLARDRLIDSWNARHA